MRRKKALLIVNAKSRNGADQLDAAIAALKAHEIEPFHRYSGSREEVSRLIVAHGKDVDLVAIGGGDGTLNAAALGMIERKLPLGILPMGTANDLARTLDIPVDLDAAVRIIATGRTRQIDLGLVNGHPFFNAASLGLSTELSRKLTHTIKRRFGRLSYGLVALKVLAGARPFHAIISSEEDTIRVKTLQIVVGNGRYYGGGNVVEKDAAIDDEHLNLYSLELSQTWKLALMAHSFRHGEHDAWQEVRAIRSKKFDISSRKPRPINADGEIVTETPAHFTVRPKAVTVFAP